MLKMYKSVSDKALEFYFEIHFMFLYCLIRDIYIYCWGICLKEVIGAFRLFLHDEVIVSTFQGQRFCAPFVVACPTAVRAAEKLT